MFGKVHSIGILGVRRVPCRDGEADVSEVSPALPWLVISLGSSEGSAGPGSDRSGGFPAPGKEKITVNLSPADIQKGDRIPAYRSRSYSTATGLVDRSILNTSVLVGELGLDGRIKTGLEVLSVWLQPGMREKRCFLPIPNVSRDRSSGHRHHWRRDIRENWQGMFNERSSCLHQTHKTEKRLFRKDVLRCGFLRGQRSVPSFSKRATEIAVWPACITSSYRSGRDWKNIVADEFQPSHAVLSHEENVEDIEYTASAAFFIQDQPLLSRQPFRSPPPHHPARL